jgi:hypothetical protein
LCRHSNLPEFSASRDAPLSAHPLKDETHDRQNQQQVDEATANVKAETEQPQKKKNDHEYGPKHLPSLCVVSTRGLKFLSGAPRAFIESRPPRKPGYFDSFACAFAFRTALRNGRATTGAFTLPVSAARVVTLCL